MSESLGLIGHRIAAADISAALGYTPQNATQLVVDVSLVRSFGYLGDGSGAQLNSKFATLAAAQAVYPHAVALTDTIDWAALQGVLNAAGATARSIRLPPGAGVLNRTVTTSAPAEIVGAGRNASTLTWASGDAWHHGTSGTPSSGPLAFRDITLNGTSSAAALTIYSTANPGLCMDHVTVSGFGQVIVATNLSGSRVSDCIWIGSLGTPLVTDAVTITATGGTFQNFFEGVQILGYSAAFNFVTSASPGIEGQWIRGCNINSCVTFVKASNTIRASTGYIAPQYNILDCEWECSGQWFVLDGISDVWITGGLGMTLGATAGLDLIAVSNATNVNLLGNSLKVFNGPRYIMNIAASVTGARIIGNDVSNLGPATTAGIYNQGAVVEERGSHWPAWGTEPRVLNAGTGSVFETLAMFAGGTQFQGTSMMFQGTVAANTDASESISITFPTRPGGGPMFTSPPLVVAANGDYSTGYANPTSVGGVTTSGCSVRFSGAGIGAPRRANWIAIGP